MTSGSAMDPLLKTVAGSLDATIESIAKVAELVEEDAPQMVRDLMRLQGVDRLEGVSLLSLKNHALLAYLNNLVLVLLTRMQLLEDVDTDAQRQRAVENTIVQRVCLEKGVKPLEKRLSYQLDKMIRSHKRMEAQSQSKDGKDNDKDSDSDSGSGSDADSSDDNLAYKPDVLALAKLTPKVAREAAAGGGDKYKPPKISALEPPKPAAAASRRSDNRKLQSMEEYLRETSDQPSMEASIGATIINHGKGGVKTNREREKEREIQTYEENNFTRLPNAATKKTHRQKQSELVNNFGGEDWSIFNNKRNVDDSTSRKRKPTTAWDRVKKRRS